MLTCATCHVYVDPRWETKLPDPGHDEFCLLDMTAAERPRRKPSPRSTRVSGPCADYRLTKSAS
jgi:hypothetical protein